MAKKSRQDGEQIVIKKYANRRLYNTDSSSYVTLDDLARMVKQDKDFIVKDAKSGEDITHSVLTQIIFEEESKGETLLPTNFLRQLITFYGGGLQKIVPDYLESSIVTFAQNQEKFRSFFENSVASSGMTGKSSNPFEQMARQNMAIFEQTMSMFSPFGSSRGTEKGEKAEDDVSQPETEPEQNPSKGSSTGVDNNQLSELQAQLATMQQQINKLQKK